MKKTTAGRKVNNVKRRLVSALLLAAVTLTATGSVWESPAETVQAAPSMNELQNRINNHQNQLNNINSQINSLQDEQDLVQEKIDDLNAEIINTMTSIGMKEDEIAEKETELADKQVQIDQTQEEYNIAKAQEEKQHDDMITRMRMMYENDSSENYVNLLFQGGGLSGMLNRMDFVESVYEYDRQKLQEYEETKEQVLALWNRRRSSRRIKTSWRLIRQIWKARSQSWMSCWRRRNRNLLISMRRLKRQSRRLLWPRRCCSRNRNS